MRATWWWFLILGVENFAAYAVRDTGRRAEQLVG
jgi:hypothetical protein